MFDHYIIIISLLIVSLYSLHYGGESMKKKEEKEIIFMFLQSILLFLLGIFNNSIVPTYLIFIGSGIMFCCGIYLAVRYDNKHKGE